MRILGFKPKLAPTLFTIPVLILLLFLSFWQFQRLQWKENLISEITLKTKIPTIELPENINLDEMLYRKVNLKGEFLHDYEMYIYGGTTKPSNEHFYYILTPLQLEDGRVIIINRGWIPEKLKDPTTRSSSLIKNLVEVTGAVMGNETKGIYIHDNQPEKNIWFYINLEEIASFINIPVEPFYILAQNNGEDFPKGREIKPNLYNNHFGYALTWLFSAISLLVIYILYHRKN
jgi:surfeit locus 1 family protein